MLKPLALTPGDPAGIGPEIVCKLLAGPLPGRPVIYGDRAVLERAALVVGANLAFQEVEHPWQEVSSRAIALMPVPWLHGELPAFGQLNPRAGAHALACIEAAGLDAMARKVEGLVTAPINKQAILPGRPDFIGHTEFLAGLAGATDFGMLLSVDHFRVLHVTTHMSVKEAIASLDTERILKTIRLGARSLDYLGVAAGVIGVCALNPHAGEGGRFGREEIEIIEPACQLARAEGLQVEGPLPPDTIFYRARLGDFPLIIAMLHDQGHIPLKMWGMERGINITVGLPFIRTSVDHGTAFDLAGSARASVSSFRCAWDLACALAARRAV